ncbi:MAG: glycosyltransferase [Clostridia bacterium]|nr:glycosyltransferase [Clostridia bacterium]
MRISLCVPMYNESSIIADTSRELHKYMTEHFGDDFEIIFADDGSRDGSAEIVRSLDLSGVRVVGYEKNQGKGCAVRCGVLASKGDIVLFTDADLAYGTDIIEQASDILEKGEYEVLVASRAKHREGYEGYTPIRKLASKIYIKVINLFGGIKISDAQCGFKGFDGDIARKIFSYCKTNNFAFDLEVILLAQKMKLKIFELPAKIINHRESKVNVVKDAIRMLKEISRIKKNVRKIDI